MTPAPTISGLIQAASTKRKQASWCLLHCERPSEDPRVDHENRVQAKELEADADALCAHAAGNADLILNIETLIAYLVQSPHQSAHRTLALRHLEDASMRLRRETGDS